MIFSFKCQECGKDVPGKDKHQVQEVVQDRRYWWNVCHACAGLPKWEAILGPIRDVSNLKPFLDRLKAQRLDDEAKRIANQC